MQMDAARWERIQALFHQALERPQAERAAFVESASTDDPAMAAEVLALLEADAAGGSLLDEELAQVAREVLDGSVPVLRMVGPYRILEVLGQGGMGVVYLAEREDLGSRVAIKVLRDASLSPARRERFEREEQTLAQLNHPSIARLYDADTLPDGTPYFVMEYVEGMPLTAYCRAHGCSLPERLRLFRAVCEAVQYAHRQAVIHRDLKPSNILVATGRRAGDAAVKLLDFGIAKQIESFDALADPTQTALRMMTPAYAAPEQLRGEPLGVYTDVYALGVILFELLAGQHPFELTGLTPGQVEARILEQEPERPSAKASRTNGGHPTAASAGAIGRDAWADLDVLCLTAMHKDPQRRYPTVEALLRDLDHFRRGEPLEARPDTLGYRTRKFLRRNRQPLAVAALVAAVLVGTVAFYTEQLREQRNRAQLEAEKARQVSDYLIGLFDASDPFAPGTDSLELRMLLVHGVERAERLAAQPGVQAQMLDVLGRVHTRLSEYDRAEDLLRRALTLRRSARDSLAMAETFANLGEMYGFTGQRDSAEAYLRAALAIRQRHLPPGHPDLGVNLNQLGSLLTDHGEYAEAEVLYRLALRIQRGAYGRPHEELGNTLSNLGVNYFNQGQHAAAEPYYREALAVDLALYGPDHPRVAVKLANLASALTGKGDLAGADSMLTQALGVLQRTLGEEHYLTAAYRIHLGSVLRKRGDHERAERMLREALAINERMHGADHPNTMVAVNQLALMLSDLGRYDDAEPLLRRAARSFRESLGDRHYYSGSSLTQLAHVLHQRGRADEAEPLFREGLAIIESLFPPDHPSLVLTRSRFGALLVTRSKFDEAEPLLLESYQALLARHGADHPHTLETARNLVALYERRGQPERAAPYRQGLAIAGDDGAR